MELHSARFVALILSLVRVLATQLQKNSYKRCMISGFKTLVIKMKG